MIHQKSEVKL